MKDPLQVGVTGGIGSGKSLVCRIFHALGVPIYDADLRAKCLMTEDKTLAELIRNEFGPSSFHPDGTLNRAHISNLTFGNPDRLKKLNSLVHPRVAIDYAQWAAANSHYPYVLREAALLYESGSYASVDKMIVVSSPEQLRIQRVIARDPQRTKEDILKIIESQWPEQEKLKRADFVIYNDDLHMVIPQVLGLHKAFTGL
jgi:dephospho-CoA kinase